MRPFISNLLKRSPRAGDGKDPAMTQPAPKPDAAPAAPDVAHLLGTLTEAMAGLAQSQRALLDALSPEPKAPAPPPHSEPAPPGSAPTAPKASAAPPQGEPGSSPAQTTDFTIGGDLPGGGNAPGAVVDFSRLSPLQQIALGLRDARPKGANAAFRAGAD